MSGISTTNQAQVSLVFRKPESLDDNYLHCYSIDVTFSECSIVTYGHYTARYESRKREYPFHDDQIL